MGMDSASVCESNDSVNTESTSLTLQIANVASHWQHPTAQTMSNGNSPVTYHQPRRSEADIAMVTPPSNSTTRRHKSGSRIRYIDRDGDAEVHHQFASATSSRDDLISSRLRLLRNVAVGALIGALVGLGLALLFIFLSRVFPFGDKTYDTVVVADSLRPPARSPYAPKQRQDMCPAIFEWIPNSLRPQTTPRPASNGIAAYLDLFHRDGLERKLSEDDDALMQQKQSLRSPVESDESESSSSVIPTQVRLQRRYLFSESSSHERPKRSKGPKLVIAGKMAVDDGTCNIAQLNLDTGQWSLSERIQLSLYNSYSGGEVYALLANHTDDRTSSDDDQPTSGGSGELIVVGAFDTTYRNSQVTYCSVGKWDGEILSKVGEGLCNSALSKGMKITTAALAGPQNVYVAGSFHTQVWNGDRHEFVKIFNIAHFNAVEQVWLPLNVGQITCSWCTVTVLALAWDSKREQLHVAGKFNSIDGRNVPAGLAIYNRKSGHLVAHPGGGLSMKNSTQDGVGTALQLDEETGVLYVMGSFERLTQTYELCLGLAAYEINAHRWTCLADAAHTVLPTGGNNMILTPYGLMVAGKTTSSTTWPDSSHPYTVALLKTTLKKKMQKSSKSISGNSGSRHSSSVLYDKVSPTNISDPIHDFNWSWLPGFDGHDEPLHALSNGFGDYEGTVFIAGDNLVAIWSYERSQDVPEEDRKAYGKTVPDLIPYTRILSKDMVRGAIMAISQMMPEPDETEERGGSGPINYTIIVYCVALGTLIGMFMAIIFNRNVSTTVMSIFSKEGQFTGLSLDTLTYSAIEQAAIMEAYQRAMETRYVSQPHLLTLIDPQEIFLQRIIGEGTFGRVWSAKWRSSKVAVKEFVFAQAAVAGRSSMQSEIIEEIIGEAGMMAILRHPNVLQLFGCSLTAQAIWIVSELCSLGSLRKLLNEKEKSLPLALRLRLALQVAEGMMYLHNQDPPIIHRDLKSHNIFVHETFTESEVSEEQKEKDLAHRSRENGGLRLVVADADHKMATESTVIAKIGDWGSARATLSGSRTMTHGVGTACWLAPEVIKHARSSKFSDVYSYGIVLWEIATREEVYQGLETMQIIAMVANEGLRPPEPMDCPWKDIMVKCWAENPNDRLDFVDIAEQLSDIYHNEHSSSYQKNCWP